MQQNIVIRGKVSLTNGWNYSPGQNPLIDPEEAFIDVAARGSDICVLDDKNSTGYLYGCGTSLSAPFVSALVGLILSVDSTLSPNQIYDIIKGTADKIGQYPYDKNGWNQYLGYGRINAYKALEAARILTDINSINDLELPNNYTLEQNYPNPFNPSTTIKYSIPQQSNVTLKVFDVLGSEVTTLVNKQQPQGNYEVEFDASYLTSGILLYRLQAGDFVETKKMILLK